MPQEYPSWEQARRVADLFGSEIDKPVSTTGYQNPSYPATSPFNQSFNQIMGPGFPGYAQNIGVTQNPPQYRGIRLNIPQTGGGYSVTQPQNERMRGFQQMVYGELIRRGYPIYGGMGTLGNSKADYPDWSPTFNPIGFGQR